MLTSCAQNISNIRTQIQIHRAGSAIEMQSFCLFDIGQHIFPFYYCYYFIIYFYYFIIAIVYFIIVTPLPETHTKRQVFDHFKPQPTPAFKMTLQTSMCQWFSIPKF